MSEQVGNTGNVLVRMRCRFGSLIGGILLSTTEFDSPAEQASSESHGGSRKDSVWNRFLYRLNPEPEPYDPNQPPEYSFAQPTITTFGYGRDPLDLLPGEDPQPTEAERAAQQEDLEFAFAAVKAGLPPLPPLDE
jgi:hypothetical protein